jgi:hypothetical protein
MKGSMKDGGKLGSPLVGRLFLHLSKTGIIGFVHGAMPRA